ncbi:MAG TPA: glycerophosphodiester phosphodiesterase family protein [Bacillota bacterium]|nr:glycerophosphodiester phosphodiesterase family protein [Bacillota bacterium]
MLEVLAARRDGYPLISGHRGTGAHAPENTLAAFRRGWELGADLLEFDVQRTRDGQVAVIHDASLERTTDGQGRVSDHTLAELQALDAGSRFGPAFAGERIPSLQQVVAWARGRIRLNIELKAAPGTLGDLPEQVADICTGHGIAGQTLVISSDHGAIRRIKERQPELAAAICFGQLADPVAAAREARADVLNTGADRITPEFCALAHGAGLGVQCYMDDPGRARQLARGGVDFLDSDWPEVVRAAVRGA